jgi:hypothetical protein
MFRRPPPGGLFLLFGVSFQEGKSMKSFLLTLVIFSLVSCSSSTSINITDPNAKIYVDGEYRGKGSVYHEDMKITGSTTEVMLVKDGCRPKNYVFKRNEEVDFGAIVGGIVLVPLLWVMKYRPTRTYEFQCEKI